MASTKSGISTADAERVIKAQARVRDAELAFGLAQQRVREATIDQTVEEGEEEEAAAVYTALETREGVYERLADLRAEEDALYAAVRALPVYSFGCMTGAHARCRLDECACACHQAQPWAREEM